MILHTSNKMLKKFSNTQESCASLYEGEETQKYLQVVKPLQRPPRQKRLTLELMDIHGSERTTSEKKTNFEIYYKQ